MATNIYSTLGNAVTSAGFRLDFSQIPTQVTFQTSSFHDVLIGGTKINFFTGGGGYDTEIGNGLQGNLFYGGEPGPEHFNGLAGSLNAASYFYATSSVTINVDDPSQNTGDAAGDSYTNINGFQGSNYDDTIIASQAGLYLDGGDGNDRFLLSQSPFAIYGGNGTDTVTVAAGGDVTLTIAYDIQRATVLNGGTLDLSAFGNLDLIRSYSTTQAVTITGTAYDDTIHAGKAGDMLHGFTGKDTLVGGIGNDTLDGGTGDDVLRGGGGNDTYIVDSFADRVTELTGNGYDTVKSSASFTLRANVEALELMGADSIKGTGNAADNAIIGNDGNNILRGMGGADVLTGGLGHDQLSGGAGNDTFVYRTAGETPVGAGRDYITDFGAGDLIDLSAIDAVAGGGDNAFTFIGSDKFSKHAGELHAVAIGANTMIEGDTTGDGKADFQILLKGTVSLSDGSFRL